MSITDGTFICGLCGESMTGCFLCGTAPLLDMREKLKKEYSELRNAEWELDMQSKSIRDAADKRRGGIF